MKTLVLTVILILIAGAGLASVLGPPRAAGQSPPMRFDNVVRDDFFAGLAGDAARFERAMKRCEDELAKDPRHAQALVWHGAGLSFRAGQAAQRGDTTAARDLSTRGLREMDEAVALAPGDTVVLLLRGVTLSRVAARIPDRGRADTLLRTAVGDYERTLKIQTDIFPGLSTHAKGELLGGLAEGWQRLGDDTQARAYLGRIVAEVPYSPYAETAEKWLARKPAAGEGLTCLGCHGD